MKYVSPGGLSRLGVVQGRLSSVLSMRLAVGIVMGISSWLGRKKGVGLRKGSGWEVHFDYGEAVG